MMSDSGIKIVYLVYHHDHNFSPLLPAWSSPPKYCTIMVTKKSLLCIVSELYISSVCDCRKTPLFSSPQFF